MKSEKGITLTETILALIMIGMTSMILIMITTTYNENIVKYETERTHYLEVIKLYEQLYLTAKTTTNKTLLYVNGRWEIKVDDKLVLWLSDNETYLVVERDHQKFKTIHNISCKVENNYLFVNFDGIKNNDMIFTRWIYV